MNEGLPTSVVLNDSEASGIFADSGSSMVVNEVMSPAGNCAEHAMIAAPIISFRIVTLIMRTSCQEWVRQQPRNRAARASIRDATQQIDSRTCDTAARRTVPVMRAAGPRGPHRIVEGRSGKPFSCALATGRIGELPAGGSAVAIVASAAPEGVVCSYDRRNSNFAEAKL
jgi:hypothetical protein